MILITIAKYSIGCFIKTETERTLHEFCRLPQIDIIGVMVIVWR